MSTYRSPSINGMTVVIVAGWLILNLLMFLFLGSAGKPSEIPTATPNDASTNLLLNPTGRSWMAGTAFGLIACISWLATSIINPFARFSIRIMAAIGGAVLLTLFSTPDFLRHAVSISGLILIQPFVFHVLAIPNWTISLSLATPNPGLHQETEAGQKPKIPQFHVGELITLTTLVALLLAASRQYTPPIASLVYWPVLIGSWFLLQTIAALTIRVVMFRQFRGLVSLGPIVVFTIVGLANAQEFVSEAPSQTGVYSQLYSFLLSGFLCSIAVLSLAGGPEMEQNLDASKDQSSAIRERAN